MTDLTRAQGAGADVEVDADMAGAGGGQRALVWAAAVLVRYMIGVTTHRSGSLVTGSTSGIAVAGVQSSSAAPPSS